MNKFWRISTATGAIAYGGGEVVPEGAIELDEIDFYAAVSQAAVAQSALPPPIPTSATKLGLKRALAETGAKAVFAAPEWPAVKAALASDPDLQEDWDLATEIRLEDPVTQAMIAMRQFTPAQVDALLIRANELVA